MAGFSPAGSQDGTPGCKDVGQVSGLDFNHLIGKQTSKTVLESDEIHLVGLNGSFAERTNGSVQSWNVIARRQNTHFLRHKCIIAKTRQLGVVTAYNRAMDRRNRLMRVLRGEPVDRPPVNFYEINGLDEKQGTPDAYNIYNDSSWTPLIELARDHSDRIVMRGVPFRTTSGDRWQDRTTVTRWEEGDSRFERLEIRADGRVLRQVTRQEQDVNTVWYVEHLLKDVADLKAYLSLPEREDNGEPVTEGVLRAERELGDSGIVMIDTPDPICQAAMLFDMQVYTVIASTEPDLFHQLLDSFARLILPRTEKVSRALPGRLWRIYGPEFASPPYLRPRWFREYVVQYDREMVKSIQQRDGFARIHSHGKLKLILDDIASMGASAIDPLEPPPQGDMQLAEIRDKIGDRMVLFGNLEASDLETLPREEFRLKIRRALREGQGGRGFVLMPSSCPYGRILNPVALANYRAMIEEVQLA